MKTIRSVFACILLSLGCFIAHAQQFSYVYIQGDKSLPFYVKLNGEMLPRYGKNYCIIPRLDPGPITIEVLFQQNALPAEQFTIKVPENGYRGFMLTKKNDQYLLYDLQQNFYLNPGNNAAEDNLPVMKIASAPVEQQQEEVIRKKEPDVKPGKKDKQPLLKPEKKKVVKEDDGSPKFIDDIELNGEHAKPVKRTDAKPEPAKKKEEPVEKPVVKEEVKPEVVTKPVPQPRKLHVTNSDCPEPLDDGKFESVYKKAMAAEDEESRLAYLMSQGNFCYSTDQERILAKSLDTDAARYTYLKRLYAHTVDQSDFQSLSDLFTDEQWKNYFLQLTNK